MQWTIAIDDSVSENRLNTMYRYSFVVLSAVTVIFFFIFLHYVNISSRLSRQSNDNDDEKSIVIDDINIVHKAFRGPHANFRPNDPYESVDVHELVLPNRQKCNSSTEMIIIIIARDTEYTNRSLVRNTWAQLLPSSTVSLVFMVGVDNDYYNRDVEQNIDKYLQIKSRLRAEIADIDDLIVVDVFETYHNLTLKTYAALRYAAIHCPSVKCVVKTDVDSIINIPAMHKICQQTKANIIRGDLNTGLPSRNLANKHFIPFYVYKPRLFPHYTSGSCYMIVGRNTTKRLLSAVERTNFYNSTNYRLLPEDLMFTGIVAAAAGIERVDTLGITYRREAEFHCFDDLQTAMPISMQISNRSWTDVLQTRLC